MNRLKSLSFIMTLLIFVLLIQKLKSVLKTLMCSICLHYQNCNKVVLTSNEFILIWQTKHSPIMKKSRTRSSKHQTIMKFATEFYITGFKDESNAINSMKINGFNSLLCPETFDLKPSKPTMTTALEELTLESRKSWQL